MRGYRHLRRTLRSGCAKLLFRSATGRSKVPDSRLAPDSQKCKRCGANRYPEPIQNRARSRCGPGLDPEGASIRKGSAPHTVTRRLRQWGDYSVPGPGLLTCPCPTRDGWRCGRYSDDVGFHPPGPTYEFGSTPRSRTSRPSPTPRAGAAFFLGRRCAGVANAVMGSCPPARSCPHCGAAARIPRLRRVQS